MSSGRLIALVRGLRPAPSLGLSRLLTWKRARNYSILLVLTYLAAWSYFNPLAGTAPLNRIGQPMGGDYVAFYAAGRLLAEGQASELYNRERVSEVQRDVTLGLIPNIYDPFRNPPFFAAVFLSLGLLDHVPSYAAWTLLSVVFVAAGVWIALDKCPDLRARPKGIACMVFGFTPIYLAMISGQNSTLALLLYALIYRALLNGREREAGVSAALGLYKPQLFLVFPLVFLASRRWRALAAYSLVGLALALLSIAIVGWNGVLEWARIVSPGPLQEGIVQHFGHRMHSVKAFFDLLLPVAPLVAIALTILVSLWLVLVLIRAWSVPGAWSENLPERWALTSAVALLVNPHLFDYDLSVLVVTGLVLAPALPQSRWWIVGFCALMFVRPTLPLGFGQLQPTVIVLFAFVIWLSHRLELPLPLRWWRRERSTTSRTLKAPALS